MTAGPQVDPLFAYCEQVIFLKDDLLLIPDSDHCAFRIYQVPSSLSPTPYIRLVQTLNLPTLKGSAVLTSFCSHIAPNATHLSAFPPHFPHGRPFLSDPESAIITFSFAVRIGDIEGEDIDYFSMIVHKKSLVDLVPLNIDEGASTPSLPWESWGPPVTRWFIINESAADFSMNSCGQRYVQCTPSIFSSPTTLREPRTITLYDFNLWRVRYVQHHQNQILASVFKNPQCNLIGIKFSREDTQPNEDGDREELLDDVCVTDKFTSNIVGKLPCVAYTSITRSEYDGLFIDDERLIGIYVSKIFVLSALTDAGEDRGRYFQDHRVRHYLLWLDILILQRNSCGI